ncbi:TMEM165/GDT1 family protein [Allorhizocola rhizosphaerae]|uniref:TMEM165/GDT1 family protein n=1 Tax=Allorhizocola rhizosphaerae TaxID=1872709 RepID=UPI000E3DDA28|nr:TMEM165/GDT1 family protein [Allorhizocola rhizosphaerae]
MEFVAAALLAFVAIFPVELPDKTFVATLVLSTRYPPMPTWIGVVLAFAVQCVIAVLAGHLLSQLPTRPVQFAAAALFAIGAVVLARGARRADAEEKSQEEEYQTKLSERAPKRGWRAVGTSFLVLFTAEWGDLSQLVIAGLVASGRDPVATGLGGLVALATVSGLAVLLGRWLLQRVRLSLIRFVGAGVCAVLAGVTLVSAL